MIRCIEPLESRRLLAVWAGTLSTNTTFTLAASPHQLTSDVYVRLGATLTIESGAVVSTNNGSSLVVGDYSAGVLLSNGATIDVPLRLDGQASGQLRGGQIKRQLTIGQPNAALLDVSSNHFTSNPLVHPAYIPFFASNTFVQNTTIGVINETVIQGNALWSKIENVTSYRLKGWGQGYVEVDANATLTIAPGVTVSADGPDMYLQAARSAGETSRIVSEGVTFDTKIVSGSGSIGSTFTHCVFNNSLEMYGVDFNLTGNTFNGGVSIAADFGVQATFSSNTFGPNAKPLVHPEFVPRLSLDGNIFAPNTVVKVMVETVVDRDTAWPLIPNVSGYQLSGYGLGYVLVDAQATLVIATGVNVSAEGREMYLQVGRTNLATLIANSVAFDVWVYINTFGTVACENSTFSSRLTLHGDARSRINIHHCNLLGSVVTPRF